MLFSLRLNRTRPATPRRCPGRLLPSLQVLEDRALPSGGISESLVALGGATPAPIPLSAASLVHDSADIGGPDDYLNLPGPATAPPSTSMIVAGNENSAITDFSGIYAGSAVLGTGTDGQGHTLYWISDTRVMQGAYRGIDGNVYHGTFVEL